MAATDELTPGAAWPGVLIATRSAGKMHELLPLLIGAGLQVETLLDAGLEETPHENLLEVFDTFEQNALAKARWFSARANGRVVLTDDSGLVVDALGGRPGVLSKRWAGSLAADGPELDAANNAYLLRELADAASAGLSDRSARYVCAAACVWAGGKLVAVGSTEGRILEAFVGRGGFGYDPLFFSRELNVTFGEASREMKQAVSHRGRAFTSLLASMRAEKSLTKMLFRPVDQDRVPG